MTLASQTSLARLAVPSPSKLGGRARRREELLLVQFRHVFQHRQMDAGSSGGGAAARGSQGGSALRESGKRGSSTLVSVPLLFFQNNRCCL